MENTIAKHHHKYIAEAWRDYSLTELGSIVHFYVKRSSHRRDPRKAKKDLEDARNYLFFMEKKLIQAEDELAESMGEEPREVVEGTE